MKSQFIRRNNNVHGQSFSVKHDLLPHFLKTWHHHQEFELVFIKSSTGTRFVGDDMAVFNPGELVLLGDSLPHMWQNDPIYFEGLDLKAEAYIIHFERDFLAGAIKEVVEFGSLEFLLERAKRGILFDSSTANNVAPMMEEIIGMPSGMSRMIKLLEVLRVLSESNGGQYLASLGYSNSATERDMKLRKVNDYIMNHFQGKVSLQEVADHVCMNKAAFCRFFKKTTSKKFSKYLNEMRVGYACKLLQQGTKPISQICFESGFNSLSSFNQQFKEVTGSTPRAYSKILH